MKKMCAILVFLGLVILPSAQAAVTVQDGEMPGQWLAFGELTDDTQTLFFEVETIDLVGFSYQIFSNLTPGGDVPGALDTVLAIYETDGTFIAWADDVGDDLNPSLFTLLPSNTTYLLGFGIHGNYDSESHEFTDIVGLDEPYAFTLSFINAEPTPLATPVPGAFLILGSGLIGVAGLRRSRG